MKKTVKILTIVALIGVLSMLFTGCDMLDDLKEMHGILSEDLQTVSFKGKSFKRLPDGIPYFFNDTYSNRCNITTEDVPVLLSEEYGQRGYYDELTGILAVNELSAYTAGIDTYISSISYLEGTQYMFFCEEEDYKAYSQLTMDDADRIGISHYNADFETAVFSHSASEEILSLIKDIGSWDSDIYEDVISNSRDVISPIFQCDKALTLKGTLNGYELYIMQSREIYLTNYYIGGAVKLSDSTVEDIFERYYDYSAQ